MISPYDSKNKLIQINPKFNLPTYYGSRDNNANIPCGLLANTKRNFIIKQHTYKTNGVGIKPVVNRFQELDITAPNLIKIKNVIYRIPDRFCKYITIIRELVDQNIPLPDILKKLTEDFNIVDPFLSDIEPSNLKNKYRFPKFDTKYKIYDNVANFSAPFKMGKLIRPTLFGANRVNFDFRYPNAEYMRYVFVSCNDGINYTNNVSDMSNDGIASFWGSRLALNGNDLSDKKNIPVNILPINNIRNIMSGSLYTTPNGDPVFFIGTNFGSKLTFIPVITLATFTALESYTTGMPFNIKTNNTYECEQTFNFSIPES
jgi:hypothetical protein